MFVLFRDPGAGKDQYQVFAGKKYAGGPGKREVFRIATDPEVAKELKRDLAVRRELSRLAKDKTTETPDMGRLRKALLDAFLELHECTTQNLRVCRDCGKMVDLSSSKQRELGKAPELKATPEFKEFVKNWACEECVIEFALLAWDEEGGPGLDVFYGRRKEIMDRYEELLNAKVPGTAARAKPAYLHSRVRTLVRVSPIVDDFKVVAHLRSNLKDSVTEIKANIARGREDMYKSLVLKSFLGYYGKYEGIRICESCGNFWRGYTNVGHTSLDTGIVSRSMEGNDGWRCTECLEEPIAIVIARDIDDKTTQTRLKVVPREKGVGQILENCVKKYVCLEFFECCAKTEKLLERLKRTKKSPDLQETITAYVNSYVKEIVEKNTSYKLCKYCRSVCDTRDQQLGYFWSTVKSVGLRCSEYKCGNHRITGVLYWNMTGWKTTEDMESSKLKSLADNDVIVLSETHLVESMVADTEKHFPKHNAIRVHATKTAVYGRGSGGLMLLVRKRLVCRQTSLLFSDRGVFRKLEFDGQDGCWIIGGVYWKPKVGEDQLMEDWLRELDNFLTIHKKNESVRVVLGGDFNAKTQAGDGHLPEAGRLKECGLEATRKSADVSRPTDARGRQLLELMRRHGMLLLNGRTRSDRQGAFTSRNVQGESVVDYVWVSDSVLPYVGDMAILDLHSKVADYHRALQLRLRIGAPPTPIKKRTRAE